jgi:hypothetical protein
MSDPKPKIYSIYQKVLLPNGRTEWVGTHRLPIASALRAAREIHDRGYRVAWRLDSERGPLPRD